MRAINDVYTELFDLAASKGDTDLLAILLQAMHYPQEQAIEDTYQAAHKETLRESLTAHLTQQFMSFASTSPLSEEQASPTSIAAKQNKKVEEEKLSIIISQLCGDESPITLIHALATHGKFAITDALLALSNPSAIDASSSSAAALPTLNTQYFIATLTFWFSNASMNPAALKPDGTRATYRYTYTDNRGERHIANIPVPALIHDNPLVAALINHPLIQRYMECRLYEKWLHSTLQANGFDLPPELFDEIIKHVCHQSQGFLGRPGELSYAKRLVDGAQILSAKTDTTPIHASLNLLSLNTNLSALDALKARHENLQQDIDTLEHNNQASCSNGIVTCQRELTAKKHEAASLKREGRQLLSSLFPPAPMQANTNSTPGIEPATTPGAEPCKAGPTSASTDTGPIRVFV